MKYFKKLTSVFLSLAIFMSCSVFVLPVFAQESTFSLRIEGETQTVLNVNLSADGENLTTHLKAALDENDISYDIEDSTYGAYIVCIDDYTPAYPVYWHIYNNSEATATGSDGVIPQADDDIVIYSGDDSLIKYPTFTFTPSDPCGGDDVVVNVSANYTEYDENWNPTQKSSNISGVILNDGYHSFTTDADGNATLTVPQNGELVFSATKETPGDDFAIVRMPEVKITGTIVSKTDDSSTITFNDSALENISTLGDLFKSTDVTDYNGALVSALCGLNSSSDSLTSIIAENDVSTTATTISGQILALTALGEDPTDINGKNLIEDLASKENVGLTGLNGYVFALLALDSYDYDLPTNSKFTRDDLIEGILSYQKSNGGFALSDSYGPDVDMTAMAISALSRYTDNSYVEDSIESALGYLSMMQTVNGGYSPDYTTYETSESISQVIIALSTLGIDPATDAQFIKNGRSLLDALASFETADGYYSHTHDGVTNSYATAQAIEALSAYNHFKNGQSSIYYIKDWFVPLSYSNNNSSSSDISDTDVSTETEETVENPSTGNSASPLIAFSVSIFALASLEFLTKRSKK